LTDGRVRDVGKAGGGDERRTVWFKMIDTLDAIAKPVRGISANLEVGTA
jgi:hypothetical protein